MLRRKQQEVGGVRGQWTGDAQHSNERGVAISVAISSI